MKKFITIYSSKYQCLLLCEFNIDLLPYQTLSWIEYWFLVYTGTYSTCMVCTCTCSMCMHGVHSILTTTEFVVSIICGKSLSGCQVHKYKSLCQCIYLNVFTSMYFPINLQYLSYQISPSVRDRNSSSLLQLLKLTHCMYVYHTLAYLLIHVLTMYLHTYL